MRVLLAAFAALLACPAAWGYANYPVLDDTASWLAMRPVTVRCLTEKETAEDVNIAVWGASAYVEIMDEGKPADYTVFEYGLCERLLALHEGTWYGTYTLKAIAWAVLALTHESGHLRGWAWWKDEAKVNVWAIRHSRYTALRLGADEHISRLLQDRAVAWCVNQPEDYNRLGCK